MAKIVLGLGQKDSLRKVIAAVEESLRETQGVPRQITCWADGMEVLAKRGHYEGEFSSFSLKFAKDFDGLDKLLEKAEANQEMCEHRADGDSHLFLSPPRGKNDYDGARKFIDEFSGALKIPEIWRAEGAKYRIEPISVELLFQAMVQYKASDCHLSPGDAPVFRIDNRTRHSELMGPLSAEQIRNVIEQMAPADDWNEFEASKQCSFSFHQVGIGYARVSAFIKAGAPHVTLRFLPEEIPSFDDLHIPSDTMTELASLHRGLLLVTGMTGSGKTTTSAALVDWINTHRQCHILTLENPVEYVHHNKKAIVSQRALGLDVLTFNEGIRGALRHDPDVIVIGEMRDPDTIRSAISAAATGHLVISTLHSNSASEVVNRIVSFFDPVERDLVKLQLRDSLRCVICQRLVAKKGGGRVPALEILFNDIKPISDGIIQGDTDMIRIGMQQTVSHSFLFEQYLHKLFKSGVIDLEAAREFASDVSLFDQLHMGTYSVPRLDSIRHH